MRTGPYDRHVAHQNIDKLRQLVHARPPQERAERRDPRIVLSRLRDFADFRFVMHRHRTKFPDNDFAVVQAPPALPENDRTR